MAVLIKEGEQFGNCLELKQEISNRGFLSRVPAERLRAELRIRREQEPIVQLAEQVTARANSKGIKIEPDRVIYSVHRDILKRPEIFLGYNRSDMTLEQIFEEDEKIQKGELPPKNQGEGRLIWTNRLAIYEPGKVRAYHGDGNPEQLAAAVNSFIEKIGGTFKPEE